MVECAWPLLLWHGLIAINFYLHKLLKCLLSPTLSFSSMNRPAKTQAMLKGCQQPWPRVILAEAIEALFLGFTLIFFKL